jgi:nucleoid DNA-binding protein
MNKAGLVKEIASRIDGAKQVDVVIMLETFQEVVKDAVKNGDKVTISNFLTFEQQHIDAKSGIVQFGDRKGEKWESPAKDVLSVKAAKAYREI